MRPTWTPQGRGQGHADLREDHLGQDDHPGGRGLGHRRQPEGQDPGEGGHPDPPAGPELRWQAAQGWRLDLGLRHQEGVPGAPHLSSSRRGQEGSSLMLGGGGHPQDPWGACDQGRQYR